MTNYKIDSRWCRVLLAMMLAILVAASSGMGLERRYFFDLPTPSAIVAYTNPSQYLMASSLVSFILSSSMSGQPATNSSSFSPIEA